MALRAMALAPAGWPFSAPHHSQEVFPEPRAPALAPAPGPRDGPSRVSSARASVSPGAAEQLLRGLSEDPPLSEEAGKQVRS